MSARSLVVTAVLLTTVACATAGGSDGPPAGRKDAGAHDAAGDDAWGAVDAGDATAMDALAADVVDDMGLTGKTCASLADGTVCGPAPNVCVDPPVCQAGVCATPLAKADGTVCKKAADACHLDATCHAGQCGPSATLPDGTSWSASDATAICCGGSPVHADTDSNCGVCGIVCNTSNGESCQVLAGHYFCRGCVASASCWSHCCATDFTPYTCAASDCAGNCDSQYCPPGTHCVAGGGTSSNYCSY